MNGHRLWVPITRRLASRLRRRQRDAGPAGRADLAAADRDQVADRPGASESRGLFSLSAIPGRQRREEPPGRRARLQRRAVGARGGTRRQPRGKALPSLSAPPAEHTEEIKSDLSLAFALRSLPRHIGLAIHNYRNSLFAVDPSGLVLTAALTNDMLCEFGP